MSIFVKDDLRASVEAATGGQVTVLYTAAGHPSYLVRIPKFNLEDIDESLGTGVHPAFIVNGVEKSEILIGQYPGIVKDGNLLSIPGVIPWVSVHFDGFRNYAVANGPGWHLMTHAEISAIALWSWRNGTMPRGNNQYGQDQTCPWETALRADGGKIGEAVGNGRSYTGAGPASWRHNGQASGIADLNGNVWEWVGGLRLQDGEIQILPNNDAADGSKDQSKTSTLWRAIKASDGSLVSPGTAGTLKYDAASEGGTGNVILSDTVTNRTGEVGDDTNAGGYPSGPLEGMGLKSGLTVPTLAKALGLYPLASSGLGGDRIWIRNHGERLPLAGGCSNHGVSAGVFARYLFYARTNVNSYVGARPAYVL
jgi:hypothetical protein